MGVSSIPGKQQTRTKQIFGARPNLKHKSGLENRVSMLPSVHHRRDVLKRDSANAHLNR
jgi:hypothetical protein